MNEIPDLDDILSILVFGDTHFKPRDYEAGQELIEKGHEVAEQISPTVIILLGDTLDTHETAKTVPFKQACSFIEGLAEIAPVYVLIGNHDLTNQSQFLTDNHFFNPLKKWPNVTIVDVPMCVDIGGYSIVLCPYVPPGRFEEALDMMSELGTLGENEEFDWRTEASCIFGHQEMEGVEYNGIVSTKGDKWPSEYPPLICGHIHTPFGPLGPGKNVFYPGSSRQVDSNENPDKRIWNVSFDDEGRLEFDKIDLGLKGRLEVELTCETASEFDFELADKFYVKIKLSGSPEQFKVFRKSHLHAKMMQHNVRIGFNPIVSSESSALLGYGVDAMKEDLSFAAILKELVEQRPVVVMQAYEDLYDVKLSRGVEFVFGGDDDE